MLTLRSKIMSSPKRVMKNESELHSFDVLARDLDLKLTDSPYKFDVDCKLVLPKSKSWSRENGNGDRENSALIFEALPGLTATEATDERIWVTLSCNQFSTYTKSRWPISISEDSKDRDKTLTNAILEHRFAGTSRARWRNNAISRLWWMAFYANSFPELDADMVLDILCLDSDLVGTLLGRPWTSNNRVVARCVIQELQKQYLCANPPSFSRENFRSTLKELDLRAGKYILAALDNNEIEKLVSSVFAKYHN